MEILDQSGRDSKVLPPLSGPTQGANHPSSEGQGHHVPIHFTPRTGWVIACVVCMVGILLLVGFFMVHHRRAHIAESLQSQKDAENAAHPVVDVMHVRYSSNTEVLTMPGSTGGWYESTIYARVTGYVDNWTADIGDHVKKDQVLARIDTPDLDARLMAAKAKLAAAEADVSVAQSSVALAQTTYDRWWNSPDGVVSQQERDEKKAELDSSMSKLKAADAQVKINQADVSSLEAFTQYKNVTAPFDGTITVRRIDIGDLVTAGSTNGTTFLYSIAQSDRLRVFIDVPQSASAGLKVGMSAIIQAGVYGDRKFKGSIARTANSIDPDSRTLHVEVDIENHDFALVPGMYVQVTFELIQQPLLQIPASALIFRSSGSQVAIVDGAGKVHFQNVSIVHDEGDLVEIAAGLSPSAEVALNLSSQIAEDDRVTANDIDNPSSAEAGVSQTPRSSIK